jgi:hypothetical protein
MFPMHTQDNLRDHEHALRRGAEHRRRHVAARDRDPALDMDAEIRALIERAEPHVACAECADQELTRRAG